MTVKTITKIAVLVALLCVSAYIAFPLPFTPTLVTAQTIMVSLIALMLRPKQAAAAIGLYVLLGICGLPVFSGGAGGLGKLLSPTCGGFVLGFLISVPLMSAAMGNGPVKIWRALLVTLCIGLPIIDLSGAVYMCLVGNTSIWAALGAMVLPFLFGDALKCVAASYLAAALEKAVPTRAVA